MAVTLDARSTTPADANGVLTIDFTTFTVGSGSNRALVVQIAWATAGGAVPTSITVNWDQLGTPQAMTQIVTKELANDRKVSLYGLVNPTAGNKTLRVSWTNSADVAVNAVSWTNVDQTGGATSFPNSTSANGTTANPTNSVTSPSGNAAMDVLSSAAQPMSAPTQTQDYIDLNNAHQNSSGSDSVAVNPSFGWTMTADTWAWVGTSIAPTGAPPPAVVDPAFSSTIFRVRRTVWGMGT